MNGPPRYVRVCEAQGTAPVSPQKVRGRARGTAASDHLIVVGAADAAD
jgi:hypothetical protein